jgi:hypothetical protein
MRDGSLLPWARIDQPTRALPANMLRHDRLHPLSPTHAAELYSVANGGGSNVGTERVSGTVWITALS